MLQRTVSEWFIFSSLYNKRMLARKHGLVSYGPQMPKLMILFSENTRFRVNNPQFNGVLESLYVGMTTE